MQYPPIVLAHGVVHGGSAAQVRDLRSRTADEQTTPGIDVALIGGIMQRGRSHNRCLGIERGAVVAESVEAFRLPGVSGGMQRREAPAVGRLDVCTAWEQQWHDGA